MQQININELKPHPRNNEFFDDITGSNWNQFLDSMRERIKNGKTGNVEPIVITQDKIIVSGHQRVRGLKELNIDQVNAEIKIYESDDEVLADLIETNIRQRGIGNPNPMKLGRCIKELERIYGIKQGNNQRTSNNFKSSKTQEDLAEELGITVQSINNYKKLTEMISELEELVDTGIATPTTALAIMRNLSEEEQLKLISSLDTTKKITQKQVQQYIEKIKELESREPKVIDNTDYSSIAKLENKIKELESQKSILERKVKLNQEDAEKFKKLKSDIEFLTKKKSDLGRQIDSATELAGLTVRLQKLLEEELAPIKFKRCIETLDSSDVCVGNLTDIITKIDGWSDEMKKLLTNKYDDIVEAQ